MANEHDYLSRELEIKDLAEGLPPTDDVAKLEALRIFQDVSLVRFFAKHAKSVEWLEWLYSEGVLKPLFNPEPEGHLTEIAHHLAWWIAENSAFTDPDNVVRLIVKEGRRINFEFGNIIAHNLQHCRHQDRNRIIRKWVAILIGIERHGEYYQSLELLMGRVVEFGETDSVLLIFEHITRPRLYAKDYSRYFEGRLRLDYEIIPMVQSGMLQHYWEKDIVPNLDNYALPLLPIITSHLNTAYHLNKATSEGDDKTIYHLGDHYLSGIEGFLYNCMKTVMEWVCEHKRDVALSILKNQLFSDVPLLQKIALQVLFKLSYESSFPITLVLQSDSLSKRRCKYEIFDILRASYRHTNRKVRDRLIGKVWDYYGDLPHGQIRKEKEFFRAAYPYELVLAVLESVPDDEKALELKGEIEDVYPKLKEITPDALDRQPEPVVEDVIPTISVQDWLGMSPIEVVTQLAGERKGMEEWDRGMNLRQLTSAVSSDFDWGWRLIEHLGKREIWDKVNWNSIFSAWVRQSFSDNQWSKILGLIPEFPELELENHLHSITWMLSDGMENKEGKIPVSLVEKAAGAASCLWSIVESHREEEIQQKEPFFTALSSYGGQLAFFWMHALSKIWNADDQSWLKLRERLKSGLEEIIKGESESSHYGRIVIASQFPFLYTREEEWAEVWVLPWFNWDDRDKAQEAWTGYLGGSRPNDKIIPLLLSHYKETLTRLSDFASEEIRQQFIIHVAIMALWSESDALTENWLLEFISEFQPEDREFFARKIWEPLAPGDADVASNQWKRWLRKYLQDRNNGVPARFSPRETAIFIELSVSLKRDFDEFVKLICDSTPPTFEHTSIFTDLNDEYFIAEKTEALLKLLAFITESLKEGFPTYQFKEIAEILEKIKEPMPYKKDLEIICNNLNRLGYPDSRQLAQSLGVIEKEE